MIITRLKGGLGNQMFQYAHGRALSLTRKDILKLDLEGYKDQPSIDTPRQFALSPFQIEAAIAIPEEIRTIRFPLGTLSRTSEFLKKIFSKISGDYDMQNRGYLNGFWTNEKYFKDIRETLLADFSLKIPFGTEATKVIDSIKTTDNQSVSLHVRRGDYVTNPHAAQHHGSCSAEYYEQALRVITEKIPAGAISLFVFSDDIAWVKENMHSLFSNTLSGRGSITYVSNPNISNCEEILVMSTCIHHIIANSTYSWWGAWLGTAEDAINIAPKQWTVRNNNRTSKIIPPTWIKI